MSHPKINVAHIEKGFSALKIDPTLLLGPGPSNVPPRVMAAMSLNIVGHLHPNFQRIMNEVQELLRYTFQTENKLTIGLTGSGAACMEATLVNVLEAGEKVVVACNGYWGDRLCNVATRQGLIPIRVEAPWGEIIPPESLIEAMEKNKAQALFVVHGESSTGIYQPLTGLGEACQKNNSLLIVDTVVTLGGMPFFADDWKVDVFYSGGQKCLASPPGVSPISFGPRAVEKMKNRKTPIASFYLDMIEVGKYWGEERVYHHTASINGVYALREALVMLSEEGLEKSWQRHRTVSEALYKGVEEMGLEMLVANPEQRLLPVTTIKIPQGVDGKAVQLHLLSKYNIEVAGGLGKLAGKVWRVGLMGHNSRLENVLLFLAAFRETLPLFGFHPRNKL